MTHYTMSQVETLTGIKSHTIRKWEQRYCFLKPMRTETNIRYYSDEMLRKLLNISVLLRHGYRISAIDEMTDAEVNQRVNEVVLSSGSAHADVIDALLAATIHMKEAEFEHIFRNQILRNGLLRTLVEVIYPFLNHVGVFWGTSKLIPAQEHFITNLIRHKLIASIEMLPQPAEQAKRILLFLPEGEYHEVGLLLSYYIAKDLGFRVFYLGQNVPLENVEESARISHADLLLTFMITPRNGDELPLLRKISREPGLPLLFSGNPEYFSGAELPGNLIHMMHPEDLITYLEKIRDL